MSTFRPTYITQLDGSRCANANCGCVGGAIAAARDWLGAKTGSAPAIRNEIGLFCPGTTNAQNDVAIKALYDTSMRRVYGISFDTFVDGIVAGSGVKFIIKYSAVKGTPYDGNPNFYGNHEIYANELRWNATLEREELLVYDPLANGRFAGCPKGPQWWPLSLVQKGVDALGVVDASFTRDTTSATRKVLYAGAAFRAKPTTASSSLGTLPRGAMVVVRTPVGGSEWLVNGHTGNLWFPATWNGKSGYIAYGWLRGPSGALS